MNWQIMYYNKIVNMRCTKMYNISGFPCIDYQLKEKCAFEDSIAQLLYNAFL